MDRQAATGRVRVPGETIALEGAPEIEVRLRRSARARRISLRVSALDGRVTLTIPALAEIDEALAFANARRDWIAAARARAPGRRAVEIGGELPVEGRPRRIVAGPGPVLSDGAVQVPPSRPAAAAMALLRTLARERFSEASDRHAARIGRHYRALALRDTRSRWGSCTAEGRLMYSWRLAMAPPAVLDYVAAHEVCHLARMDHSPAFWRLVSDLCPDWRTQRDWLRREGPGLHAYGFED